MLYFLSSPDNKVRVTFDCTYRTIATGSVVARLSRMIETHIMTNVTPGQRGTIQYSLGTVDNFCQMFAATRRIDFEALDGADLEEYEHIADLKEFWTWACENLIILEKNRGRIKAVGIRDDEPAAAHLWDMFTRMVSNPIQEHWYKAAEAAQVIYPVSPLLKPESMLTAEERADPAFLAPAPPNVKNSVSGQ